MRVVRPAPILLGILLLLTPLASAQLALPAGVNHNYATMEQELRDLVAQNPDVATMTILGKSVRGLDLWRIDIADFADPAWEAAPAMLVDGGHHGNEVSGIQAAFLVAQHYILEAAKDPSILDGNRIVVVPAVNPDGWVQPSRTNANQVNLNRNYPWMWDARGTDPNVGGGNYAGPSAGSEPETKLMMALMGELNLYAYVSYHCCGPEPGGEVVLPWSVEKDGPNPDQGVYDTYLAKLESAHGVLGRDPSGTGESIAHALGNLGVFAILPETQPEANQPVSAEGPDRFKEQVGITLFTFENLRRLGAHLVHDEAADTITNVGWAPALNATIEGLPVPDWMPGDVRAVTAAACGDVVYERMQNGAGSRAIETVKIRPIGHCAILKGDALIADAESMFDVPGFPVGLTLLAAVGLGVLRRRA